MSMLAIACEGRRVCVEVVGRELGVEGNIPVF